MGLLGIIFVAMATQQTPRPLVSIISPRQD
nr:MAG TPA: hypothetical protein [Caudoviricetes sp.]